MALMVSAAACSSSGGSTTAKAKSLEVSPSGDIPDTQAYVAFTPPSGGYTIKVPEGWARSAIGAKTTFADHFNTVAVEATSSASAPTEASVRAVDVPTLQRTSIGFQLNQITSTTRTAGPVIVVTYGLTSPSDPTTGKHVTLAAEGYQFWRNGTLVTVTLSAPKGSDNIDPWKTITNSFAWTK
jgi:hypothetical protein